MENLDQLTKKIIDLQNYQGEDAVISSLDYQALLKNQPPAKKMGCWLMPSLDGMLNGFQEGELIVLSGATGHGKTTLAQSLTQGLLKNDTKSLWFSYEMKPSQFFAKFPELPLFYLPKTLKDKSTNWIEEKIIEAKLKFGVKTVFIDHLHFLVDLIKMRQPSLEIGSIVRSLKLLAIEYDVAIFLLAHLMKTKLDCEPDNDSLRDSSFIAQEADIVLMICRKQNKQTKEFTNEAIIKITKNRREGLIGKMIPVIYSKGMLIEEIYEEI